jgi:hypothetical protein
MFRGVNLAPSFAGLRRRWPAFLLTFWLMLGALAGEFNLNIARPTLDRWMYPFNFEPGIRSAASTYGSFDPRFDTRDAQFLLGWDTADVLPTNAPPHQYLIRRLRVALTTTAKVENSFLYDPTYDSYLTYATNQPGYVPDTDAGRPVELYGVGFRGGFTAETFLENSSYGPLNPITSDDISIGTRNAYAAQFDANGALIDIANHVGQANANWTNAPFEAHPWSVGQTTNAAPGELVPIDSVITFDVDFTDPLTVGYLQRALSEGRLRLMVSSLSPARQVTPGGTGGGGSGAYPQLATKENALYDAPRLELEGVLVGDTDSDHDGLPDDWEQFYFANLDALAVADGDGDAASNAAEFATGTDPTRSASVFRLLGFGFDDSGLATLRFTVAPSRQYRVEAAGSFSSWQPVDGQLTYPAPGVAEFREAPSPLPVERPVRFYRVVVE